MNRGFSLIAAIILIAGLAFYFFGNKPASPPAPQPDGGGGTVVTGDPAPSGETDNDTPPAPQEVFYLPVGQLDNRGTGQVDPTVWSPDMRFPIKSGKAYANTQVYRWGGSNEPGPGNGQCDTRNYSYPWEDTFCETRSNALSTPRCAKKVSIHQGQDIRPATCEFKKHMAVAAEAGEILDIGIYRVVLSADSGRTYNYLHLDMANLKVQDGKRVEKGDAIGWVDDDFKPGSTTTLHLHFEIVMAAPGKDGVPTITPVSPYMSLVKAYERLQAEDPGTQ